MIEQATQCGPRIPGSIASVDRDPLSPWYGEAVAYEVVAPERGALQLYPSRVVCFLGNAWPDPSVAATVWSDSVLLALYDAVHAVALTTAGATSLMHEAKVDVVTVPNLSEHLSSADTTAQLSARFAYAAAMKSINTLLLLGDGETWARQRIDFAGLPEMVRTFLQVAAGAADIPVTRLLGQSPAGLSATGDSDTRNYYDMISARQEIDLRPQLERLDRLILRSEGIDPGALTFAFRPLWQMDAATAATVALTKAQATQVYAGMGLWPAATTARLVAAQLIEDGTYPGAEPVFAEAEAGGTGAYPAGASPALDFDPGQPRSPDGKWTAGGGGATSSPESSPAAVAGKSRSQASASQHSPSPTELNRPGQASGFMGLISTLNPIGTAWAQEDDPKPELADPLAELRRERYVNARMALRAIDPSNRALETLSAPDYVSSEADIARLEGAAREAAIARTCDFLRPNGQPIGQRGTSSSIRVLSGGRAAAQRDYDYLSVGGTAVPFDNGLMVRLPGSAGTVTLRPVTSTPGSPAIDVTIPGIIFRKLHY